MHRRVRPRMHRFRYRAFWLLVDLDELAHLHRELRFFSHNASNLFSCRDADHGDGSDMPLRSQVKRLLEDAGLSIREGRVFLLCIPRVLGYCFNPLSIYFCHEADGTLAACVYQVHNTFGDRHSYVIPVTQASDVIHQRCQKAFFVSPFMDMELQYEFRLSGPDERLSLGIAACDAKGTMFNAVLAAGREDLTDRALLRLGLTMPLLTLKVIAAIHWQGLRLWLKGVGFQRRSAPSLSGLGSAVDTHISTLD
jgi:DUF1365 family protein